VISEHSLAIAPQLKTAPQERLLRSQGEPSCLNLSSHGGSSISTVSQLKKKLDELQKKYQSTKILLFMVIHDLKHPTESLIANVKQIIQMVQFTQTQLANAQAENERIEKKINQLLDKNGSLFEQKAHNLLMKSDFLRIDKEASLPSVGKEESKSEESDGK